GIYAVNFKDHPDDELVAVRISNGEQVAFLATREGQAIRFRENEVRPMGRVAYGVRGIELRNNDYVVGATLVDSPETRENKRDELATEPRLKAELLKVRE